MAKQVWDFETVNAHVNKQRPKTQAQVNKAIENLAWCDSYKAARPVLVLVSQLVLIPAKWRQLVSTLVAVLDGVCGIT